MSLLTVRFKDEEFCFLFGSSLLLWFGIFLLKYTRLLRFPSI